MLCYAISLGGTNKSALSIVGDILRSSGYRGLYRGWLSSILRDCPFSAIYWLSFESLRPIYAAAFRGRSGDDAVSSIADEAKDSEARTTSTSSSSSCSSSSSNSSMRRTEGDGTRRRPAVVVYTPSSIGSTFLAGASGGLLAALITHPFDVMKTHQQLGAYHHLTTTPTCPTTPNSSSSKYPPSVDLLSPIRRLGVRGLFSGLTMRLFTVIPASAIMVTIYETIKNMDL